MADDLWAFQTAAAAKAFIDFIMRRNRGEIALMWPQDPDLRTIAVDGEQTRQLAIAFYWGWEFAIRALANTPSDTIDSPCQK